MISSRWKIRATLLLLAAFFSTAQALSQIQPAPAPVAFSPIQISIAHSSALDMLTKAVSSPKSAVRRDGIVAFSLVGDAQALPIIEKALSDKDAEVRAQAINCLADLNAQSSIPKLKPLLQDKSPEVAFAAAHALSQLGDPSGRDVLIEVLTGERHVSGSLISSGVDWAKQISPTNLLFLGASQTASIFVGPYAGVGIVAARQLFGDRSAPARVTSAQSLAPDDSERAIDILQKALHDHNWTVRVAAAQALGNAPSPDPIAQLLPLLHDKRREVRFVAASSIIRLASPGPQQNALHDPLQLENSSSTFPQFPQNLTQHPE